MRPVSDISCDENPRIELRFGFEVLKCDPREPEPVGTIVLMAFRITGYRPDCDGSLMAFLEHVDKNGETTGWEEDAVGVTPNDSLVVTPDELRSLFSHPVEETHPA